MSRSHFPVFSCFQRIRLLEDFWECLGKKNRKKEHVHYTAITTKTNFFFGAVNLSNEIHGLIKWWVLIKFLCWFGRLKRSWDGQRLDPCNRKTTVRIHFNSMWKKRYILSKFNYKNSIVQTSIKTWNLGSVLQFESALNMVKIITMAFTCWICPNSSTYFSIYLVNTNMKLSAK